MAAVTDADAPFPLTDGGTIEAASDPSGAARREALTERRRAYWYPIYGPIRPPAGCARRACCGSR